ncbi:MAG: aldo/keto reductase [Candidatus Saccharimonadales bacterium]
MFTAPIEFLRGNKSSIPTIGLGTWQMDSTVVRDTIKQALHVGYRHIDTAKVYGNEAAIADGINDSGIARQDIFITTKIMPIATTEVESAIHERLKLLKTDYIDLLLIHWPPETGVAADMWVAMEAEQQAGVVRTIGVSNYTESQIIQLIKQTKIVPAVNQIEINPFTSRSSLRHFCDTHGIIVEAYSPLKQATSFDNALIAQLAQEHGRSSAQIMLRWCIERNTIPLPKATSLNHLKENLEVFDFELKDHALKQLDAL